VHRLTAEIADWLGVEGGRLAVGARADVVVVDPGALDARLDEVHEAPVPGMDGLQRLVRRNDQAVSLVVVGGRIAWRDGAMRPEVGREPGFGRWLPRRGTPDPFTAGLDAPLRAAG
jgi:N-acyl-D-aspartate/D-glutamate deacylase